MLRIDSISSPRTAQSPHRRLTSASHRSWRLRAAVLAVLAVAVAGCDSGGSSSGEGQAADRSAGAADSLKGVCPDTVAIQQNWWPQAEYGFLFRLLGKDVKIDADKKIASAPLVSGGADTG